jgi:hypothetical protein
MKKEINLSFALFFLIILNLIIVNAAPPQTQIVDKGIIIIYPKINYVPLNSNYTFHFHTFNVSNGAKLDNSTLTCSFHLYNYMDKHIARFNYNVPMESDLIDWAVYVNKENFTEPGDYSYIIQCNNTAGYGGADSVFFRVASNNSTTETSESIFYFLVTLIIFFFFIGMAVITYIMPYNNKRNEKGEIFFIPKTKYIKLVLIPITYALFVWLLNLLVGISDNFITLGMYYGLITFLFNVCITLSYPLLIFVLIIAVYNILKDIEVHKQIKKFGSVKNGN